MSLKVAITCRCRKEDLESSVLLIAEEYGRHPLRKRDRGEIADRVSKQVSRTEGKKVKISSRKVAGILKKNAYPRRGGKNNCGVAAIPHLQRRNNRCCVS